MNFQRVVNQASYSKNTEMVVDSDTDSYGSDEEEASPMTHDAELLIDHSVGSDSKEEKEESPAALSEEALSKLESRLLAFDQASSSKNVEVDVDADSDSDDSYEEETRPIGHAMEHAIGETTNSER